MSEVKKKMRAKVCVGSAIPYESPQGKMLVLKLFGVAKNDGYPADGSDENNSFARWSPSISVDMLIANPALVDAFEPGDTFYIDFIPAPK